jgi:hypothetical protein
MPLDHQKKVHLHYYEGISFFLLTVGDLKIFLTLSQIPKENFGIDFDPIFNNKDLSIYKTEVTKFM